MRGQTSSEGFSPNGHKSPKRAELAPEHPKGHRIREEVPWGIPFEVGEAKFGAFCSNFKK